MQNEIMLLVKLAKHAKDKAQTSLFKINDLNVAMFASLREVGLSFYSA